MPPTKLMNARRFIRSPRRRHGRLDIHEHEIGASDPALATLSGRRVFSMDVCFGASWLADCCTCSRQLMGWPGRAQRPTTTVEQDGEASKLKELMMHTHQKSSDPIATIGLDIGKNTFHLVGPLASSEAGTVNPTSDHAADAPPARAMNSRRRMRPPGSTRISEYQKSHASTKAIAASQSDEARNVGCGSMNETALA
jgi:hypothetical protein